jgi:hypothetical protein
MIGDKHAFLEIDALVPVSDPTLRWPGANRGAKSESCLPLRWPKGECLRATTRLAKTIGSQFLSLRRSYRSQRSPLRFGAVKSPTSKGSASNLRTPGIPAGPNFLSRQRRDDANGQTALAGAGAGLRLPFRTLGLTF